jgi:hypothetical protein
MVPLAGERWGRGSAGCRVLTEALHGVCAEDLAGPLGPEVVTGSILTVTPTEHQLVAVFLLLRSHVPKSSPSCSPDLGPYLAASRDLSLSQAVSQGGSSHCPLWGTLPQTLTPGAA